MSWQHDICEELGGKLAVKKMEMTMLSLLKEMIEAGCDINERQWRGCPLWATLLDDSEVPASIIRYLLKEGASLHVDDGDEPLLFRALSNDMNSEIIKLLIEYGADASYVSEEQETALQIACRRHEYNVDTLSLLIEHGCPINVQKSECGNSALGNAALADLPSETLSYLIKQGADIHAADSKGNTPLMRLCSNAICSSDSVALFIEAGADLAHKNHDGNTALGILCSGSGDENMLEVLVEHGMDVNAVENGLTYPMMAVLNRNWAALDKLLSLGFSNYAVVYPESQKTLVEVINEEIEDCWDDAVAARIKQVIAQL
jgi:ankyrin repeat protein